MDFRKLAGVRSSAVDPDPLRIFDSLDRRASHAALREAQGVALRALHQRRAERDLVLKMPTGLGKSAVGLLFLRSHMAASGRGAVYLCPTVQLVRQVLREAAQLGIAAHEYPRGEKYPHADCLRGEAVTVCTYDKLFNARTTFERADVQFVPEAVVCDDSHSGIEEVRDAFTLRITDEAPYNALRDVIDAGCAAYDRGVWDDIRSGRPGPSMELPYWAWDAVHDDARAALAPFGDLDELKFVWPRLRDHLLWTRVVASAAAIEISPIVPAVEDVRPYSEAKHRLFMSATLADDSALALLLDCEETAATTPVGAGADSPPGERLVITPALIDPALDRTWTIGWSASMAKQVTVVALCASERDAQDWVAAGATLGDRNNIEDVLANLRTGLLRFAAFAQRYDGIDLPDDACRILVIDGLPAGQGVTDAFDSSRTRMVGGPRDRLVHRIEQGMGRAVRSPADYAVVVLSGHDLASYVSNVDVRSRFGRDVQLQLEVAREITESARSETGASDELVDDVTRQVLRRDSGWRAYYDDRVRKPLAGSTVGSHGVGVKIASLQRRAARQAMSGDIKAASTSISEAISSAPDVATEGRLLFEKARYVHVVDPAESFKTLAAARVKAPQAVPRPPAGAAVTRVATNEDAGSRILRHAARFASMNGLVAEFAAFRARLSFELPPSEFEAGIESLGEFIGCESTRPEKETGHGPDNLFMWPDLAWVIEAKNQASYNALPKGYAEQLLHSMAWFKSEYPNVQRVTAVSVGPSARVESGVHPPVGTRVIMAAQLERLLRAVESFIAALAAKSASAWEPSQVAALLVSHGLNSGQIEQRFTTSTVD